MDSVRLPLSVAYEPRNPEAKKDSAILNGYVDDAQSSTPYVAKRPGLEAKTSALGQGLGIFFYDGVLFSFNSNQGPFEINTTVPFDGEFFFGLYSQTGGDTTVTTVQKITTTGTISSANYIGVSASSRTRLILHTGTRYIAYDAQNEQVYYSTDAATWTAVSVDAGEWSQGGVIGSTIFLVDATTHPTEVLVSTDDGNTWTLTAITGDLSNSGFNLVGTGSFYTTGTKYTSNGTTWATSNLPSPASRVAYNGTDTYVAVYGDAIPRGYIYSSTNGTTWTQRVSDPVVFNFFDVHWAGDKFLAFGAAGAGNNKIVASSTDGITWDYVGFIYYPSGSTTASFYYNGLSYVTYSFLDPISNTYAQYYSTSPDGILWSGSQAMNVTPPDFPVTQITGF
jgi:hypothetical protein